MSGLRVGLLGCGGIGARHARAIAALPERMEMVACCGRDPERTAAFALEHGGAAFTDCDKMLERADLDILVVALPPYAHAGEVEQAASAGIHLLVEKPIALDMQRAHAMVAACENAGVVAACGFMYRFGEAVTHWDSLSALGKTGPVGHFSGAFHCNALHAPWWRERSRSGGQMVEQLIHIVDLARHWMGLPQSVYARAANLFHSRVPRYDSEDVSAMILGYETGAIATLHASNAAVPGQWRKGWQVVARDATGIFADFNAADIFSVAAPEAVERIAGSREVFTAQLEDLADAIAQSRSPRVPLRDGLDTLRVVLAARESADTGREVVL